MTIEKLSGKYCLVTTDLERQGVLEHIYSSHKTIVDKMDKYPILFVNTDNGEYKDVYGCPSMIPFNHLTLDKLK